MTAKCNTIQMKYRIEVNYDLDSANSLSNLIRTVTIKKKFSCLAECSKMENCKTASFSVQESTCKLYDKLEIDATPVKIQSNGRNLYFKKSINVTIEYLLIENSY